MKYAVEMGSSAVIYIPSFIKIGSGTQKLMGGGHTHTHSIEIAYTAQAVRRWPVTAESRVQFPVISIQIRGGQSMEHIKNWTGFVWLRIGSSGGLL
jgi:hypothetical protein